MTSQKLIMFAVLFAATAVFAAPPEAPVVPTYWSKPSTGDAKGMAFSSETRSGGTLSILFDGLGLSLQNDTKALSAIRSTTLSAKLTPKPGEKVKQCRVTVRGSTITANGGKVHLAVTSGETTKIARLSSSKAGKGDVAYQFNAPVTKVTSADGVDVYQIAISLALIAERAHEGIDILAQIDSLDIAATLK